MTYICVIAGEASGDFLGAKLIDALKARDGALQLGGVGGPLMGQSGLLSLFPYEDLAVMGIAEVLPKLPVLLKRIQQTADYILETKPDIVVSIDSPDFCFRVIKKVKKAGGRLPRFVHYVAPTVWAWREGRAAALAQLVDGLICLFDFEPPYFEKHGLKSIAVGHPMVEGAAMNANGQTFREEYGIAKSERVMGVLFGSRIGEIKNTGRILRDAAYMVAQRMENNIHIVAPTLPHMKDSVSRLLKDAPCAIHITQEPDEKYDAFKSMDVALAVSGTVGLELAALQVPHIIAYKTNPITAAIIKHMVKVKYAHLANIMAGREIVPEFLQERCVDKDMADAAMALMEDSRIQRHDFANIAQRLGYGQQKTPSQKAAAFVLGFVGSPPARG